MLDVLEAIEAELQRLGLWEAVPPPPAALMSSAPFCYDTLSFPQWLQWVFIPRCQHLVLTRRGIPQSSDIHSMGEVYLAEAGLDSPELLAGLARFDEIIARWNAPGNEPH